VPANFDSQKGNNSVNVLEGPRRERRHVIVGGSSYWVTAEGDTLTLPDGRQVSASTVQHLPPCAPTKILATHLAYWSRQRENRPGQQPSTPTYFSKPVTTLNSHGGELVRPVGCQYLNYEGEIAAIIGRVTRNVSPDEVWDCIAGFAVANDVGLQDFRDTDGGSMLRVKGQDGFCPIGPGIVSGVDVRQSILRTYLNGQLVQQASVAEEMIFGIDYQIADLARYITLVPGDIILTGTPANSRPMQLGDVVEVEVTGLGRIRNTVVSAPDPRATVGHMPTDSAEVRRVALGSDERLPAGLNRVPVPKR
jgi:5-oxopent-3-ene-1,2,5-tricarboxylate decarboxylase / 2-hydroxyhepta-2,4-diene-1,7-dioate isomerase